MIRALPLISIMLAACTPQPSGAEAPRQAPAANDGAAAQPGGNQPGSGCDASKAQFAIGQSYTDALANQARTAAGAAIVRRLMPGQAVTMEFNEQRLNLETNEKGVVVAATCG